MIFYPIFNFILSITRNLISWLVLSWLDSNLQNSVSFWQNIFIFHPAKRYLPAGATRLGLTLSLVALSLISEVALHAEDIRSDANVPALETVSENNALSDEEQRKAVAMAAFSRLFMSPSAKEIKKSLYTVLENDPKAKTPLKIALFSLNKSSEVDEILTKMTSIAKRNPSALAINLTVIAYLYDHKKFDTAEFLAQNSLNAIADAERLSPNDLILYVNIIAMRGLVYEKKENFEAGEVFFDSMLDDKLLYDNFIVMKAAAIFFSIASKQSSDDPLLWLWKSDRERLKDKKYHILQRIEPIAKAPKQLGELAKLYEQLNMPERAESVLVDYLMEHEDNESIMLILAKMLTRNKDSRALLYWQALLQRSSDEPLYLREAGNAAWNEGYIAESANYFELYLKKRPKSRGVGLRLAMIYMGQGEFASALELLKKQPSSFYVLQGIGLIKLHRSDYKGALTSFEAAAALLPAEKQSLFFCLNMLITADYAANLELVKRYAGILRLNFPNKIADYGNALGYTLANNNIELELAENILKQALKAVPGRLETLDSMAWLLYRKKSYKAALKYIKLSLKACGEYPHAVIADHAGDIYLALGDSVNALKYWNIAVGVYSVDLNRTALRKKIKKHTNP